MKSEQEILTIIANGIASTVKGMEEYSDFNIIVCTERIFLDDYAPKVQDYISKLSVNMAEDGSYDLDSLPDGYESPEQMPYQHTIFFILKMGQGQINFAVWNCPVSIQIVSEENSIDAARAMAMAFMRSKNFKYEDGIIQSYFTPEVASSQQEMYAGFRALLSIRGFIRSPEDRVMFVTNAKISLGDGDSFDYPFLTITFNHTAQSDPQAFSGYLGATMSLNRMTVQSISITGYLWNWNGDDIDDESESISEDEREIRKQQRLLTEFSRAVIGSMANMNAKFRISLLSNVLDENGDPLAICDAWFILTSANYSQELGGLAPWSLTFARAKMEAEQNG